MLFIVGTYQRDVLPGKFAILEIPIDIWVCSLDVALHFMVHLDNPVNNDYGMV